MGINDRCSEQLLVHHKSSFSVSFLLGDQAFFPQGFAIKYSKNVSFFVPISCHPPSPGKNRSHANHKSFAWLQAYFIFSCILYFNRLLSAYWSLFYISFTFIYLLLLVYVANNLGNPGSMILLYKNINQLKRGPQFPVATYHVIIMSLHISYSG